MGKTSLVDALSEKLALPVIPELGREICRDMGYERIGDIPDQESFKKSVLDAQIDTETKLPSFISDRSTIDCWVLWQRWNICSAMSYDTESYYERARKQALTYTHIVYLPLMFSPPEDGFRWTDPDYQRQIDRLTRMTLYEWNLLDLVYIIQSDNLQERVRNVLSWLSSE